VPREIEIVRADEEKAGKEISYCGIDISQPERTRKAEGNYSASVQERAASNFHSHIRGVSLVGSQGI